MRKVNLNEMAYYLHHSKDDTLFHHLEVLRDLQLKGQMKFLRQYHKRF
jgi:hypothetical protein